MTTPEGIRGNGFYEDPELLDAYLSHRRAAVTSPSLVMEDPAFRSEAGDLAGLHILDLGCGDGTFAKACVAAGCQRYVGVDGSQGMVSRARDNAPFTNVEFRLAELEYYEPEVDSFDLVVSRMALHYVRDLKPVFARVRRSIRGIGRLIFSVAHPVITSGNEAAEGPRQSQVVDNYFSPGDRRREWFGQPVLWQHRTVEQYVDLTLYAGFRLDRLRECEPVRALFGDDANEYARRLRVPVFLLISASRNPAAD